VAVPKERRSHVPAHRIDGRPAGTEDDRATKPVPAGRFIRSATGLVEGRRLEERDVAMEPERSGRFAGQGPAGAPCTATGFGDPRV